MRTNHTCLICQTAYYYCPSCEESRRTGKDKETWRMLTHDENCHIIFDTLQRNSIGEFTDAEASEKLKKCDLSVLKTATQAIQEQINKILKAVQPQVDKSAKKVNIKN